MRTTVVAAFVIAFLFHGCGKPAPEEYLAKGKEAEERAQRIVDTLSTPPDLPGLFAPAIEAYSDLAANYPNSPLASDAVFRLATIYHNDTREFEKAIDAYRRYTAMNPGGEKVPLAMFLTGYLYNNELRNLDSAGAAYRRFLEKFPHHEMAMAAQFELNNLGKTPEEMLQKDVASQEPATPAAPPRTRKK